ncbi:MAG: M20 family metallopeptidase [Trueperaceae bacterium]|nr:MAG: M20 family metallopeptidase [Trueperaceae bacterium]
MDGDLLPLAQRAAEAVDTEQVVKLTCDLVKIRSVYEPDKGGTEAEAAHHIAALLGDLGLEPIVEETAPGRPNVICDWQGRGFDPAHHKTLMFEGHTDVVTEGDPQRWQYPPFAATIEGDRLYGRGSADMKGGIAAAIAALCAIKEVAPDLPGRIRLGIVADEEGMMTGIKHFIAQGWAEEVDGAIICEPEENEICLWQKGAMRLNVDFHGVMAHGAMPYAGKNPITALATFTGRIQELERAEQARLGEHPYLGLPWITPTIVKAPPSGEAQHNVMPESAYLALDIRTVPGQNHETLLAALRTVADEVERQHDLTIELDCFESRPWTETSRDDIVVRAVEDAYPLVLGTPPRYGGVPGATDGTFLFASAGIPIVTIGPGDRTIPHQLDEFVRISELIESARLYAASAVLYLGAGQKS